MTDKYLLASDLSDDSAASEKYVRDFLEPERASIHLFTVIDLFDEGKIREFPDELNPEKLEKRHKKNALEVLQSRAEWLEDNGFTTETEAVHGRPGPAICRRARELDVRGIFVGRGSHGRLGEVFQGSVSRYVVMNSSKSIIVTPTQRKDG